MRKKAIAFDFDGTLVSNGRYNLDKGVHIMYSSWMACYEYGYKQFLHPENIDSDLKRLVDAYICYPGAPRFEQLSSIVNSLINNNQQSVDSPDEYHIPKELEDCYPAVKEKYNSLYSALNETAAEYHWKAYPSIHMIQKTLAEDYDLYIASGVTQEVLEHDFHYHKFDESLFLGIFGSNKSGGDDKGQILKKILDNGYEAVLFIGDSNKDLEYAKTAGVNFYRVSRDEDYLELVEILPNGFPDLDDIWDFNQQEMSFFYEKTGLLLQNFVNGTEMSLKDITDWINKE